MFSRIGHGVCPNYGRLAQASRPAHGCSPNVLAAFSGLGYSPASGCSGMGMVQRVATVAFEGIEARSVTVQVQVAPGLPAFNVVGLGDKAVSEARERVRAALTSSGLALPS